MVSVLLVRIGILTTFTMLYLLRKKDVFFTLRGKTFFLMRDISDSELLIQYTCTKHLMEKYNYFL